MQTSPIFPSVTFQTIVLFERHILVFFYHIIGPIIGSGRPSVNGHSQLQRKAIILKFRKSLISRLCVCDQFHRCGQSTFNLLFFRCMYTTVSEGTGRRHPQLEPFTTLKTYRPLTEWQQSLRPCFGVWHKVLKPGNVTVGNIVWLARKTNQPAL